jgi:hypothetical protein
MSLVDITFSVALAVTLVIIAYTILEKDEKDS